MATEWSYILGKTPPPGTPRGENIVRIGELPARQRNLRVANNRGGSAGVQTRFLHKMSQQVRPLTTSLMVVRDGKELWSGPVVTMAGAPPDEWMTIGAVGWLEVLGWREIREDRDYTGTNPNTGSLWKDSEIIFDLLETVKAYDPEYAPPIYSGQAYGTRYTRQRFFTRGTKLDEIFRELTSVEAGIDLEIDPVTRELDIYSWDSYVDRPTVHFGYQAGPDNCSSAPWSMDGTSVRNRFHAFGLGGVSPGPYEDSASKAEFGIMEETVGLVDIPNVDVLAAYAVGEVELKKKPYIKYEIKPKTTGEEVSRPSNIPRLFHDFFVRDMVRWSINEGFLIANKMPVRVFGGGISIDENNNETLDSLNILATDA